MATFEIVMPKLGESIIEATITKWLKNIGDSVSEDDSICELATDKVDSEIPSPVDGILLNRFFEEGAVVPVGSVIAIIKLDSVNDKDSEKAEILELHETPQDLSSSDNTVAPIQVVDYFSERFYSPLVRNIATKENVSIKELDTIQGSGKNGRVTKADLLTFIEFRLQKLDAKPSILTQTILPETKKVTTFLGDEIIEMDRMRQLIAEHMVMSKSTSPHVTSFIDVDMSKVFQWREKNKIAFQEKTGEKITFTPIFIEAAARALREFPMANSSVDGKKIILRKRVNIGMATALPNGNLIVPVIKDADQKNLTGLAKDVNSLADKARNNKLLPDDISDGTFTISNFGTFESTTGTPIINQPQVAILGVGMIQKKPVVIETDMGDVIGIRHMMILSLAYDHRIVDGALGGKFIKFIKDYLENWDIKRLI